MSAKELGHELLVNNLAVLQPVLSRVSCVEKVGSVPGPGRSGRKGPTTTVTKDL